MLFGLINKINTVNRHCVDIRLSGFGLAYDDASDLVLGPYATEVLARTPGSPNHHLGYADYYTIANSNLNSGSDERLKQLVLVCKSTIRQYPGNAVNSRGHQVSYFNLPQAADPFFYSLPVSHGFRLSPRHSWSHGEPAPRRLAVGSLRYRRR